MPFIPPHLLHAHAQVHESNGNTGSPRLDKATLVRGHRRGCVLGMAAVAAMVPFVHLQPVNGSLCDLTPRPPTVTPCHGLWVGAQQ